jgi:hypothetical protein
MTAKWLTIKYPIEPTPAEGAQIRVLSPEEIHAGIEDGLHQLGMDEEEFWQQYIEGKLPHTFEIKLLATRLQNQK